MISYKSYVSSSVTLLSSITIIVVINITVITITVTIAIMITVTIIVITIIVTIIVIIVIVIKRTILSGMAADIVYAPAGTGNTGNDADVDAVDVGGVGN